MARNEYDFHNDVNRIANMLEAQKKLREDCKIKLFYNNADCMKDSMDNLEEEMNEFIKDKIVIDVKMSEMGMAGDNGFASDRTILVIYKDKKA